MLTRTAHMSDLVTDNLASILLHIYGRGLDYAARAT